MARIDLVILISIIVFISFKQFQKLCLWLVFDYKVKNEKILKLLVKLCPILLAIGIGRIPHKKK